MSEAIRDDWLTSAAVAVLASATANFIHETVGHGGACVAIGGRALALTYGSFNCGTDGVSAAGQRVMAAGGTIMNFVAAAVGYLVYRRARPATAWRFALWLFVTVNLLQGAGYFLFSGL